MTHKTKSRIAAKANALMDQASVAIQSHDLDKGDRCFVEAFRLAGNTAAFRIRRAAHLFLTGRPGDAEADLRCALSRLEQKPNQHFSDWANYLLGEVLLSQGLFEEGWQRFDGRRRLGRDTGAGFGDLQQMRALPIPEWLGEKVILKRILVLPEQGLGDHIQFA